MKPRFLAVLFVCVALNACGQDHCSDPRTRYIDGNGVEEQDGKVLIRYSCVASGGTLQITTLDGVPVAEDTSQGDGNGAAAFCLPPGDYQWTFDGYHCECDNDPAVTRLPVAFTVQSGNVTTARLIDWDADCEA